MSQRVLIKLSGEITNTAPQQFNLTKYVSFCILTNYHWQHLRQSEKDKYYDRILCTGGRVGWGCQEYSMGQVVAHNSKYSNCKVVSTDNYLFWIMLQHMEEDFISELAM